MDSIDIFIYVAEILVVVGVIAAVVLPLIKSLDNPGSLVKTGIGVLILAAIFFVAFSISDGEVSAKFAADPFNISPTMSKFVGGSLLTTYILFFVAVIGSIFMEINKAIK
jgi:NADH:ubiquinone oxidoreductase subunit 6 (subunit J)